MLARLLVEHQSSAQARKADIEAKKQRALLAVNELSQSVVDELNVGVATAYLNERRLDAEAKELHTHVNSFAKQTQGWLTLVDNFNAAIKELGDVETWAKCIEQDLQTVATALEYTAKVDQQMNQAGQS